MPLLPIHRISSPHRSHPPPFLRRNPHWPMKTPLGRDSEVVGRNFSVPLYLSPQASREEAQEWEGMLLCSTPTVVLWLVSHRFRLMLSPHFEGWSAYPQSSKAFRDTLPS